MENLNMFDMMFDNEKVNIPVKEVVVTKTTTKTVKDKISSNDDKKLVEEKVRKRMEEIKNTPKVDPNAEMEKKAKEFPRLSIKYFGDEIFDLEGEEEIKDFTLAKLADRLVNEYGYEELNENINWILSHNADKSVGYLLVTYPQFYHKG